MFNETKKVTVCPEKFKSLRAHFQGFTQVLLTLSFFLCMFITILGGFSEEYRANLQALVLLVLFPHYKTECHNNSIA